MLQRFFLNRNLDFSQILTFFNGNVYAEVEIFFFCFPQININSFNNLNNCFNAVFFLIFEIIRFLAIH